MCLKVVEKDFTNHQHVFNVAESLGGKREGSDGSEGTKASAAGVFANRKDSHATQYHVRRNMRSELPRLPC
eukprot:1570413-Lingulodinium_polyedra.AAC.1